MASGDPLIGTVLAGYRLLDRVGEGAVGVVYRGEHSQSGHLAAIKVLKPEVASKADVVVRFFQEARTIGALGHPGIVRIFDFAIEPHTSRVYMTMEFLHGEPLADRIAKEGALPSDLAVGLGIQIAESVSALHAQNLVHRDLKPGNIFLLEREGSDLPLVKLIDFGLAKSFGEGQSVTLTLSGTPVGTPAYMAPEQVRGQPVDARADIYSLGTVLYEMLAGTPPFDSTELGEILIQQAKERHPPLSSRCSVSPELEFIVDRCLQKEASERFADMKAVRLALERVATAEGNAAIGRGRVGADSVSAYSSAWGSTLRLRRPWMPRVLWGMAIAAVLAAGVVALQGPFGEEDGERGRFGDGGDGGAARSDAGGVLLGEAVRHRTGSAAEAGTRRRDAGGRALGEAAAEVWNDGGPQGTAVHQRPVTRRARRGAPRREGATGNGRLGAGGGKRGGRGRVRRRAARDEGGPVRGGGGRPADAGVTRTGGSAAKGARVERRSDGAPKRSPEEDEERRDERKWRPTEGTIDPFMD